MRPQVVHRRRLPRHKQRLQRSEPKPVLCGEPQSCRRVLAGNGDVPQRKLQVYSRVQGHPQHRLQGHQKVPFCEVRRKKRSDKRIDGARPAVKHHAFHRGWRWRWRKCRVGTLICSGQLRRRIRIRIRI